MATAINTRMPLKGLRWTEVNQGKPFSGMRVLIAVAIGAGLGLAVAYSLKVLIDNSPAEIALGLSLIHI